MSDKIAKNAPKIASFFVELKKGLGYIIEIGKAFGEGVWEATKGIVEGIATAFKALTGNSKKSKEKQMRKRLYFFVVMMLTTICAFAQSLHVKGTVTDENKEPVIGAYVRIKGVDRGALTDVNGKFELKNVKKSDQTCKIGRAHV